MVIACEVIHLLQYPELIAALAEVRRVLRSKGEFIFSARNFHHWTTHGVFEVMPNGGPYLKRFSIGYTRHLGRLTGFSVSSIEFYKWALNRMKAWPAVSLVEKVVSNIPVLRRKMCEWMLVRMEKID
jgi:ubiquinone/menaquinone biosynthesis C-methylase UbiE